MQKVLHGLQTVKCLLSGPLQRKFANCYYTINSYSFVFKKKWNYVICIFVNISTLHLILPYRMYLVISEIMEVVLLIITFYYYFFNSCFPNKIFFLLYSMVTQLHISCFKFLCFISLIMRFGLKFIIFF